MGRIHSYYRRVLAVVLVALLVVLGGGLWFGGGYVRTLLGDQIMNRDAALLAVLSRHAVANVVSDDPAADLDYVDLALQASELSTVLGLAIHAADGTVVAALPDTLLVDDLERLPAGMVVGDAQPELVWHPALDLGALFGDLAGTLDSATTPILEVRVAVDDPVYGLLPITLRYFLAGESMARELAILERRVLVQGLTVWAGAGLLLMVLFECAGWYLRRISQALEQRTVALEKANSELAMAAKSSAVGAISAHLVHGLRNPLAGLRRYLTTNHGDAQAVEAARRMQDLVDEVVTALRHEEVGLNAAFSLEDVVEHLRAKFSALAGKGGKEFLCAADGAAVIPARSAQLVIFILSNLLHNAFDATASGGTVRLTAKRVADHVEWQVADTGPGIQPDRVPRLFSPMATRKADGCGIGLAISAQMARHIDATLTLALTGPKGSVFSLKMPVGEC
jgi:signal transduction histidine kinase